MEKIIKKCIGDECIKLSKRYYEYLYELEQNIQRKSRRLGVSLQKQVLIPEYWKIHQGFDPFKVSTTKCLNTYAYTLSKQLKSLMYKPKTAVIHTIPKESGGTRDLNIFQIPDAAISRMVYKSLLGKNVNLFSGYAYAYREDRNAHDAILKISSDWRMRDRVYIAEFDFSKFFDRISHDYLWKTLNTHGFLFTEMEEYILRVFLNSRFAFRADYRSGESKQRERGIPQGTSISLFLANVVCLELDQELEHIGVQFARYADDTLIWSNSYEQVVRAYDAISYFSKQMDVPINFEKSEGITLLSEKASQELKSKRQVKFLGYDLSLKQVSISDKTVAHIKKKLSYIIYENLLQPLEHGVFNSSQLNLIDWDYLIALAQIRRYLYGGLNDIKLHSFKIGVINHLNFRGVMSYYPLVNDDKQLKFLDGWLIHTLKHALLRRRETWKRIKGIDLPGPIPDWIDNIVSIKKWIHPVSKEVYDFRIPSFLQISQAMRVGMKRGGIKSVTNPKSVYYPGRAIPKP